MRICQPDNGKESKRTHVQRQRNEVSSDCLRRKAPQRPRESSAERLCGALALDLTTFRDEIFMTLSEEDRVKGVFEGGLNVERASEEQRDDVGCATYLSRGKYMRKLAPTFTQDDRDGQNKGQRTGEQGHEGDDGQVGEGESEKEDDDREDERLDDRSCAALQLAFACSRKT